MAQANNANTNAKDNVFRVSVSNAGDKQCNGTYDICNNYSKFPILNAIDDNHSNNKDNKPEFIYLHLADDKKTECLIYLKESSNNDASWLLSKRALDDKPSDLPQILYETKQVEKSNIPPLDGWKCVNGTEPAPKLKIEAFSIEKPIKENNISLANEDKDKMAKVMFNDDKKEQKDVDLEKINKKIHDKGMKEDLKATSDPKWVGAGTSTKSNIKENARETFKSAPKKIDT